ncbi:MULTISPECIES: MFS transporter [unclassified Novosphingobium]|uniref:MFS transporter n=1 Tax=unclassified Novosphingobium TaxID=2644732 RepID=UPI00086B9EB0|nr:MULTISPECIES: MFS transporter [unclassified Novosphingobium]MBN9144303.1 MFS transporter [Novosphingobium sp.]MDR6707625.1 putative MFS family arabinose efflux permease [Novosphingobium sp. 1748]ODU77779.1 MAG: MFS transporter [Novosphingobium sp. SCN 63-17]OJX93435.1 MAG: MFS transporter [Novosphingobium sp. 63-713]
MSAPDPNAATRRGAAYQIWVVGLLSLNFGIVFFDRNAPNFLMPFIQHDLGFSNKAVGLLSSALSLTWAIAGFVVGGLSDRMGKQKIVVVWASLAFCLCSFVSGAAGSFMVLFAARLLMGVAEGGIMPVSHAMIVEEVAPARRGMAMGIGQNLGSNLLGSFVAPLVLVWIANTWGWREGFYLAALPGIVTAALIAFTLREPPREAHEHAERPKVTMREAFANRNVILCAAIAVLLVSYLVVCWAFMPLYLTKVRAMAPETMSWMMAVLGISAGLGSFLVPAISDAIGRKPVMIGFSALGMLLPLGALYYTGGSWGLAAIFFFGWGLNGLFPMFMATIPSESVDPRLAATLTGMVMGAGEVLGGVLSPFVAGAAADVWGLGAPLWIMLGLALAATVLALGLLESAPAVLARRVR